MGIPNFLIPAPGQVEELREAFFERLQRESPTGKLSDGSEDINKT